MTAPIASTPTSVELVQTDDWLTAVCGRTVVRVAGGVESLRSADAAEWLSQSLRRSGADFAFAKLDTRQVAAAESLQQAGFRVVDVSIVLETPAAPEAVARRSAQSTGPVEIVSLESMPEKAARSHAIARIASECFRYSRFHLDPRFPDRDADAIKREWIVNYLRGARGDRLWGAQVDVRWAGFLAAITTSDGDAAIIDLIGVDSDHQGQGVGGQLIAAFQEHYSPRVRVLRVGTQAANTPSLRLYQKMGFRFASSAFVLHWRAD